MDLLDDHEAATTMENGNQTAATRWRFAFKNVNKALVRCRVCASYLLLDPPKQSLSDILLLVVRARGRASSWHQPLLTLPSGFHKIVHVPLA
jgi:hypothetical protein